MKSKFDGLNAGKKKTAAPTPDGPTRGRPKGTAPDAVPVTLHLSAETYRRARIALLEADDKRPLSKIAELLLDQWSAGKVKLPDA